MQSTELLRGGVARVDITPPVPIDLIGATRRWQPAEDVLRPLTATAIVLDGSDSRIAIVGVDLGIVPQAMATTVRTQIAQAIGTTVDQVLLNVSHTHTAPQPFNGGVKIGGTQSRLTHTEHSFIDSWPRRVVEACQMAAAGLQTIRVGGGSVEVQGWTINRREVDSDGSVVHGHNPDGACDRELSVLRVDQLDGSPLALIVNFACHPVVLGPECLLVGPDFVGPLRDTVEKNTDATCLFIQGAAGDINPTEALFDAPGPEVRFGERIGWDVLRIYADIRTQTEKTIQIEYASMRPMILRRRVPSEEQEPQGLASLSRMVELDFRERPSLTNLYQALAQYQQDYERAVIRGDDKAQLNALELHVKWAENAIWQLESGQSERCLRAFLQVIRIGRFAIVGVPGEAFSEIALRIKRDSPADLTLFAGYSNGVLTYFPGEEDYKYGGYEVDYAHHTYGLVEQVAKDSADRIVGNSLDLLVDLFGQ